MTTQESFKKRIRARMQKTGEKYNAARRALIEQADQRRQDGADHAHDGGHREGRDGSVRRAWAAAPEHSDEVVREATGRGWDTWVDLIEADPVADEGHTAVAAWLQEAHDVDGWWAQAVTGGWERITGRRLPHQMPDGTFTANKSRTMEVDVDAVRALLVDDEGRAALLPWPDTELRSRPTSKSLRVGLEQGVALFAFDDRGDGRTTVTVSHEKLPRHEDVEVWKAFWDEWLDALADAV